MEKKDEYYIDEEQLGCCGVEDTMYKIIRSIDPSWMPKERGRVVHTLEDNPNLGQVTVNNLTFSYEELSALRELINHFCVKKSIFNDLYTKHNCDDDLKGRLEESFRYYVSSTNQRYFDAYDGDEPMEYIGAPC